MILVIAGTSEARLLASNLLAKKYKVMATVVTEYGANLLKESGLKDIIVGRKSEEDFKEIITTNQIKTVVDASHPYATEVSETILNAANKLKINYLRLERKDVPLPDNDLIIKATSLEDAMEKTFSRGKIVFSTLGSKHLPDLVKYAHKAQKKLITRVLPTSDVIKICEDLGLKPDNIIALKGPFSKDLNKALFKEYNADVVLTKESGPNGGESEKLDACLELKIPCVVWTRPKIDYPVVFNNPKDIINYLKDNQIDR